MSTFEHKHTHVLISGCHPWLYKCGVANRVSMEVATGSHWIFPDQRSFPSFLSKLVEKVERLGIFYSGIKIINLLALYFRGYDPLANGPELQLLPPYNFARGNKNKWKCKINMFPIPHRINFLLRCQSSSSVKATPQPHPLLPTVSFLLLLLTHTRFICCWHEDKDATKLGTSSKENM